MENYDAESSSLKDSEVLSFSWQKFSKIWSPIGNLKLFFPCPKDHSEDAFPAGRNPTNMIKYLSADMLTLSSRRADRQLWVGVDFCWALMAEAWSLLWQKDGRHLQTGWDWFLGVWCGQSTEIVIGFYGDLSYDSDRLPLHWGLTSWAHPLKYSL